MEEENNISKTISPKLKKTFFIVWVSVGTVVLFAVLGYLLNILAIPVSMFIWTMVIVFCLRGLVAGLEKRGINRLISTSLAYVVMFLVLGIIGFLMFSPMFGINDQFINLISNFPGYVDALSVWVGDVSHKYESVLANDNVKALLESATDSLSKSVSGIAGNAANAAVGVGATIANTCTAVGFALVIAFWVLLELPALGTEVRRVIGKKHAEEAEFFHITFTRILGGYIKGTIIQCLIIGGACGLLFAIVDVDNAPALGVITGVLNIIPIVGPWAGGAVAAVTAALSSPLKALIVLCGTIVIQQFVYTFISPRIMQNSVDIHPALTLIAMIFGSSIGGAMSGLMGSLVGMLFAIPAVAVIKAVFIYYFEKNTGRQIVGLDGFIFKGKPSMGVVDPLFDATSGSAKSKTDNNPQNSVDDDEQSNVIERVENKLHINHHSD